MTAGDSMSELRRFAVMQPVDAAEEIRSLRARVEALLADVRSERQLREEAERERDKAQDKWVSDRGALLAERDALALRIDGAVELWRMAEGRVAVLEAALRDVLANPRWVSVGSINNQAELQRVSREKYERLGAVLAGGDVAAESEPDAV